MNNPLSLVDQLGFGGNLYCMSNPSDFEGMSGNWVSNNFQSPAPETGAELFQFQNPLGGDYWQMISCVLVYSVNNTGPGLGGSSGGGGGGNGAKLTKSPARQECEKNADQKQQQAKAGALNDAGTAALVGWGVSMIVDAGAGCVAGGLAGGAVGALSGSEFGPPGAGTVGALGFGAGCAAGGTGSMLWGVVSGKDAADALLSAGITYGVDRLNASQQYSTDMAACSLIP